MNCWPSGKYVHLLYMYSILGWGSFCFNYCLNSAWHGGDQFVALLRWYGSPGFFDSGLQLICIEVVPCFSFYSWQYLIDSLGFGSGEFAGQSSTPTLNHGHLTNFWCFWQCGQYQIPRHVCVWCSWCLDPSLSPFLVKFTQILELILLDNPHKAAVLSVGCASFSSTLFPSTQLSVKMLGYSTLWTASFFGNECLWLILLVKGVKDCLLDNCQISNLPHDCVA